MKKIVINIHPHKSEKEKQFLKMLKKFFPLAVIGVVVLIFLNIVFFIFTKFSYAPYDRLDKEWKDLNPKAQAVSALKAEITALEAKQQMYEQMVTHKIQLSRTFTELFKSLPENIWLGDITFRNGQINFVGYVVEWKGDFSSSINNFISNLQGEGYFSKTFKDIDPKGRRTIDYYGRKIMQFEVECKN